MLALSLALFAIAFSSGAAFCYWLFFSFLRFGPVGGAKDIKDDDEDKEKPELLVKDWKEGIVYLIQLPVAPHSRTGSPFALKLETWLRLCKVKYEPRYSTRMSSRQQTPFVELDGVQYPDSNLVMKVLREKGVGVDPDEVAGVKEERGKMARAHMARIMIEHHTTLFGFYWRYGTKARLDEFAKKMFVNRPEKAKWWPADLVWKTQFLVEFRHRYFKIGTARHTQEQQEEVSCRDLRALEDAAESGEDKFYLGTSDPTSVDCMIFAHLAQFLYIPMDFPQKKFLNAECPQLVSLVSRVRSRLWPDWERMCTAECMEGYMG